MNHTSVIIIGGGPAGLALACELSRGGIAFLLLEAGPAPGNTFRNMAANTTYGPWINNLLPHSRVPLADLLQRTHREEYAEYLSDYAISNQLSIVTGATVEKVVKPGQLFEVHTNQGLFVAPVVVNATGYFSNPKQVKYPGCDQTCIRQIHAGQFREAATVRQITGQNRARILIVGKRLTAGETMQRLVKAGYEVALSTRSKIEYGPSRMLEACVSPFTFVIEEVLARLPGAPLPPNLDVKMSGGLQRRLVESGVVKVFPEIQQIHRESVVFSDGQEQPFDLIIYATGYQPALAHLSALVALDPKTGYPPLLGFESKQMPGLYFLGLIGLRTFRSQFLRGIREDAVCLAEILAQSVVAPEASMRVG